MPFFVFYPPSPLPHFCTIQRKQSLHLIRTSMKKLLFALLFLASLGTLSAQGWQRTYNGGGFDVINGLAQTPDGGYILAGYYNSFRVYLIKTDADGKQQWSKFYSPADFGAQAAAQSVIATKDSSYAVVGYRTVTAAKRDILLFKTDGYGNILWSKSFGGTREDQGLGLVEMPNGDLVVCGYQSVSDSEEALFVARTDKKGNLIWVKSYNPAQHIKRGNSVTLAPNGDLVVVGYMQTTLASNNKDVYVTRINAANGDMIWDKTFDIAGKDDFGRAAVMAKDGNIVIAGEAAADGKAGGLLFKIDGTGTNNNPIWNEAIPKTTFYGLTQATDGGYFITGRQTINDNFEDLYIGRFTSEGTNIWSKNIGRGGTDEGHSIVATADGGAVATGFSDQYLDPLGGSPTLAYLVKIDQNGLVYTNYLNCNVFRDFDGNCLQDGGEPNLSNWIVKVENPDLGNQYAVANEMGQFLLPVDTGTFKLSLYPPNSYWESCTPFVVAKVSSFYDTVSVSMPARLKFDCPNNQVDVSTPILRRCADNVYSVHYCNFGPAPSKNTFVEIQFDPALTVKSSSIPGFPVSGTNTYRYNIGTLGSNDCGFFSVTANLDCNDVAGQAHCVEAHIYPDSFCNIPNNWDGSIIRAAAYCDNDTLKLSLKNVGSGGLTTALEYIITEDVVMLTDPKDPAFSITDLDPGEERVVYSRPANGKTYRIFTQQPPGYPGNGYPTAGVEGCATDTTSTISTGFYTMFPQDDADDFIATDCQESAETDYAPTQLKRGHPKGYGVPHYVTPQTDLDFLIQFRNSGPDTVQQVIIRDTLPLELDPATVRPGAASHAYDFQVYGNGIVQFTLPTAYLVPGSSASEGFVRFRVAQRPGLPCNTVIRNRAAIFFDFNAPALTGQTFHTVCEQDSFLKFIVKTTNIAWPGADVRIVPNPFAQSTQFEIKGVQAEVFALDLFDAQGRKLSTEFFNHSTFRLFRNRLPVGVIFYRLAADGKPVATGRLLVAGE